MLFNIGNMIVPIGGVSPRWKVDQIQQDSTLTFLRLSDCHPDVAAPMRRETVGVCLNFHNSGADIWTIQNWRSQFHAACQAASVNVSGVPEPVDFFQIESTEPLLRQHPDVSREEYFWVYAYGDFAPARPVWPKRRQGNREVTRTTREIYNLIRKFTMDIGHILAALHNAGVVVRQLPLKALRFMNTTRKYSIGEFLAFAPSGSCQYDPHIRYLVLLPKFAAPECFEVGRPVTPQTDVYALGVAMLCYLGNTNLKPAPSEADIDACLAETEKRFGARMPETLGRTLKLALKSDPRQRHQNIHAMIAMLSGKDMLARPAHNRSRQQSGGPRSHSKRSRRI